MSQAPIVLFTYNRPEHTRRTVEALQRNDGAAKSDLYVYSDGAKTDRHAQAVSDTRAYLRGIDGFKTVTLMERAQNMGLAESVIAGVSDALERHPSVIVLEDDMLTAPNFLAFMNEALATYAPRTDVFSVTGYNYPLPIPKDYPRDAYLSYRGSSWGWGTWADRWRKVDWSMRDFDAFLTDPKQLALFARGGEDLLGMLKAQMEGRTNSWSIRFDYTHFRYNAFCLHAVRSKIQNIGFDGSGVHCDVSNDYKVELDPGDRPFKLPPDLKPDPAILKIFDSHFRPSLTAKPGWKRTKSMLSRMGRRARQIARLISQSS